MDTNVETADFNQSEVIDNGKLSKEAKRNKLISFAYSILQDRLYQKQFISLMEKFSVTENDIIQSFLDYNLDIFAFDNSIYNSISNRFVLHVHNLIKGSWHEERQNTIIELLNIAQPTKLIDIGFGVPSKYIQDFVFKHKSVKAVLCDFSEASMQFATALMSEWDSNWHDMVSFKIVDMNEVEKIGNFDMYMFQDSIEHVPDPTGCLCKYTSLSPDSAKFIFSLPIGPSIPAHYIAWENDQAAVTWLNRCGLNVTHQKAVWVNSEIDLFAEPLGSDLHNLIVLCSKEI